MEFGLDKILVVYGPLGILALIGLFSAGYMFKTLTAERRTCTLETKSHLDQMERIGKAHDDQIERITKEHKTEIRALEERYISKAESWAQKWHEESNANFALIEELKTKRGGRRGE